MCYLCFVKNEIAVFSELGERLLMFGETPESRDVIARASRANSWFLPDEIIRSAAAIRTGMLASEKLASWLLPYSLPVPVPRRVLVVMAGNIPLVGFFDLLCVLVSGHRCLVKPSGKDRVLMEYIVGLLRHIEPALALEFYDGRSPVDAVIATGSDNSNRYFKARYAAIPALLRGSRRSVAVLCGNETERQLAGLSDDLFAYSGLGCRNVSLLFLPEGVRPRLKMPRMNPKYRNNYLQERALLEMTGTPFLDLGEAVAVEEWEFPRALSRISYARYRDMRQVEAWLEKHDAELQCVVSQCVAHPRQVNFGRAQSPALTDYPDAVDVLAFLERLGQECCAS